MTGSGGRQDGSQVDRTILAWDRTALALVGNGVLLLVRDLGPAGGPALVAAAAALVAALAVAVLGRRRARSLRHGGATTPAATLPLYTAGAAVLAIGVCVSVVLLLSAAS